MKSDLCIVVVADTHVGDRISHLDPKLLEALTAEKPDEIWHAGDVCQPGAIDELNHIAPTLAVEGNRDWFLRYRLPREIHRQINGLKITLAHGHVNIMAWALNYLRLFATGRQVGHQRFQQALATLYPDADVIIYGHLHKPIDEFMDGQRFINPGVGYPERRSEFRSRYARLDFKSEGSLHVALKSVADHEDFPL